MLEAVCQAPRRLRRTSQGLAFKNQQSQEVDNRGADRKGKKMQSPVGAQEVEGWNLVVLEGWGKTRGRMTRRGLGTGLEHSEDTG